MSILRAFKYAISPLEALVLIHHVVHSEDAENDADRTVSEIVSEIDAFDGYLSKAVLESALYCCNLENEKKKFWHPLNESFDRFLKDVIPRDKHFDRYYNCIYDKKEESKDGPTTKTRR